MTTDNLKLMFIIDISFVAPSPKVAGFVTNPATSPITQETNLISQGGIINKF